MAEFASSLRTRADMLPCTACPLRQRPSFRQFDDDELAFVGRFKSGEMHIEAGVDILNEAAHSAHFFTLLRGWAFRYVILPEGRRQILNFLLPGDLVGLQAGLFEAMRHSVAALTDLTLCVFQRKDLWSLFREQPALGYDVTWLAAHEESMVDANLATVGQRTAMARIAYLILHLHERLKGLDLTPTGGFEFPLTQQHMADALGLSLVHTNKTLRRLTGRGFIKVTRGRLVILDLDGLNELTGMEVEEARPRPFI